MHSDFYDWLRTLTPDGDIANLASVQWWEAVEKFAELATAPDIVGLAFSAYERPVPSFDKRFRNHLREHDESSPLRGLHRQIAVLAGASLIQIGGARRTYLSEDLRLCAFHAGWTPAIEDLVLTSEDIRAYSSQQRELPNWPQIKASLTLTETKKLVPEDGAAVTNDALRKVLDSFSKSITGSVDRSVSAVLRAAKGRETPALEQAEVLAWLLGGRSILMDMPWKKLSASLASVCAAIDLEALSSFETGRPDAAAIIGFAVDSAGRRTNAELRTVTATVQERMDRFSAEDWSMVEPLVPIFSMLCREELPDLGPVETGLRLHDEHFLLKAYESLLEAE